MIKLQLVDYLSIFSLKVKRKQYFLLIQQTIPNDLNYAVNDLIEMNKDHPKIDFKTVQWKFGFANFHLHLNSTLSIYLNLKV